MRPSRIQAEGANRFSVGLELSEQLDAHLSITHLFCVHYICLKFCVNLDLIQDAPE